MSNKYVITHLPDIGKPKRYWDMYACTFVDQNGTSCHFGSHTAASAYLKAINEQVHGGLVQVEPVIAG